MANLFSSMCVSFFESSMWYLPENSNLTAAHNDHNLQRSILARSLNSRSTPMGPPGSISNGLPTSSPKMSRNTLPTGVHDSNGFNERMSPQALQTAIRGLLHSTDLPRSGDRSSKDGTKQKNKGSGADGGGEEKFLQLQKDILFQKYQEEIDYAHSKCV